MVMGVPNNETGDTTPQAVWIAECITHLLEGDAKLDADLTVDFARHEAHELWQACGQTLSPRDAAYRWLGHEEACDAVHSVLHRERQVMDEDPLDHDMPQP